MGEISTDQVRWLEPADAGRWDDCVARHPAGCLAMTSRWNELLHRSFPHMRGRILALESATDRRLTAGLAVHEVRSRILGRRWVSVPFATLCSPAVSDSAQAAALMKVLLGAFRESRASRLEIRAWRNAAAFRETGLAESSFFKHHYLPLDQPLDRIRSSLHKTAVLQPLAKAEKQGFQIRVSSAEQDLRAFYQLFLGIRRKLGLPAFPYRFFHELTSLLPLGRDSFLIVAAAGGTPVGAALAFRFRDVFMLEFLGDIDAYRRAGITQFVYWEAIRLAHRENCSLFSFGRTSPRNVGLMAYKSRWNTQVEDLPVLYHPQDLMGDSDDQEESAAFRMVRTMCRSLPLPAYRLMGYFLYRHMG